MPLNRRAVFSSQSVEWPTPQGVYARLDGEFKFTLDPCPITGDAGDGRSPLWQPWDGQRVFCNPPYGSQIPKFLARWKEPELAVYLIPARTDTRWFHAICLPHADEIRFIKGRLTFGGAKAPAPFPSMVVVFRNAPLDLESPLHIPSAHAMGISEDKSGDDAGAPRKDAQRASRIL